MTMHVNLSKEMETYIKGKVASGFYANATEVIRDAIRRMHAEEAHAARFVAAVEEGEADIDAGRVTPYSPQLMEQLMQQAMAAAGTDEPVDPDVIP